jgi:hypothetical protein
MFYKVLYVSICEEIFNTIETTTMKGAINISIIHINQGNLSRYLFTPQKQSKLIMLIESNLLITIQTCGTRRVTIRAWALEIEMTNVITVFTKKTIKLINLFTELAYSLVPHSGFFICMVDTIIFLVMTLFTRSMYSTKINMLIGNRTFRGLSMFIAINNNNITFYASVLKRFMIHDMSQMYP